jgi:hypothetical protein
MAWRRASGWLASVGLQGRLRAVAEAGLLLARVLAACVLRARLCRGVERGGDLVSGGRRAVLRSRALLGDRGQRVRRAWRGSLGGSARGSRGRLRVGGLSQQRGGVGGRVCLRGGRGRCRLSGEREAVGSGQSSCIGGCVGGRATGQCRRGGCGLLCKHRGGQAAAAACASLEGVEPSSLACVLSSFLPVVALVLPLSFCCGVLEAPDVLACVVCCRVFCDASSFGALVWLESGLLATGCALCGALSRAR